ncbi:MAG: S41 family peptidase [Pseudomonadota bacterium]|nr:S41 family peptidase [Pseudomonadota bacterium]MDE3038429.1 S41 family peptidase [Pseudomonadota bacterium]
MRRFAKLSLVAGLLLALPLAAYAAKDDTLQLLDLFGEVFDRVRTDYVEPVKDSDLIEAAINGMLTSLDPHSGYMNEKAFQEMQVQTKGEFGGLGIEVTMDNGLVKVVSPIDDTPAAKAGIKPGDYISYINDDAVMGLTLSDAVDKMRGPVGSKVKLTILREDENEPIELTLTRAEIKIKSVKMHAEGDDIAYIRITSFTEQTTDLLHSEFDRLKKSLPRLRGIVLDLRNNPGGLLDQAVSVSDAFLTGGEIVSTRERDPSKTKRYSAHSGDELVPEDVPVVVLVNNGSASASEIVAGALQDHKRAIILGTKTFGKGSVQTVIPLTGHGAIRLTTARYYTPSGRSIQALGITPDIVVEQAKIEPIKNSDKIRTEAELRHRLANLQELKAREKKKAEAAKKEDDDKTDEEKSASNRNGKLDNADSNPADAQDFQLQRALDLLRAISIYSKAAPDK